VIAVATTNPIESLGKADLAVASLQDVTWPLFRDLFRGQFRGLFWRPH
jgi:hypothetical protein